MNELQNFKVLGIALAIGLLIGLERGWHLRDKAEGMRIAGLRTYGLIALLGGLWAIVARQVGAILMGFAFLGLAFVLLTAYSKSLSKSEDYSITSIIASFITFTLGALTVFGHSVLASATAVVIAFLLGFKPLLHGWMKKLEQRELEATLNLLLISVVMLPILPDRGFGPWNAVNPYLIWLLVVLIAGISYLGYFAIRMVGNRHGPVLTGFFGGLVSSSALTLNLSRLAKVHPDMHNALAAGILTAWATMFARVLLLTSILNAALFQLLIPSLTLMCIFTYLMSYLLWKKAPEFQENEEIRLENPFQLAMAMKFGVFLVMVLLLSKFLQAYFGDMGAYVIAGISGIADVDPITLLMSQLSKEGLEIEVAARAVLVAVAINSIVKSGMVFFVGDHKLGIRVSVILVAALAGGLTMELISF